MGKKDKKKENKDKKNFYYGILKFLLGLLKPIKKLIEFHIDFAVAEFKKEGKRVMNGIVAMLFGCLFLSIFFLLLNVLAVIFFYDILNIRLFYSVLIVLGINLLLAIIMFAFSRARLKDEIFSETKKNIKKTIDDLQ